MYCAQKERDPGDFASLAIRNKRLEFRFNTGSGTAKIESDPIRDGQWIEVCLPNVVLNSSLLAELDLFVCIACIYK